MWSMRPTNQSADYNYFHDDHINDYHHDNNFNNNIYDHDEYDFNNGWRIWLI